MFQDQLCQALSQSDGHSWTTQALKTRKRPQESWAHWQLDFNNRNSLKIVDQTYEFHREMTWNSWAAAADSLQLGDLIIQIFVGSDFSASFFVVPKGVFNKECVLALAWLFPSHCFPSEKYYQLARAAKKWWGVSVHRIIHINVFFLAHVVVNFLIMLDPTLVSNEDSFSLPSRRQSWFSLFGC